MRFVDIHNHMLYDVDDGAKESDTMRAMLDASYADGVRTLCVTPHFHPGFFGDNVAAAEKAFAEAKRYAEEKYPDLALFFGNELRYDKNCLSWLENGHCKTMNDSRYVLVDFIENEDADYIVTSMRRIMNAGYIPVLAHAERYIDFHRDMREIKQLQECGVLIQIDAQSPFGGWGKSAKKRSRKLIEHYFADVIASDAHNLTERPTFMNSCYQYVVEKCDEKYAEKLFIENPLEILNGSDLGKELY